MRFLHFKITTISHSTDRFTSLLPVQRIYWIRDCLQIAQYFCYAAETDPQVQLDNCFSMERLYGRLIYSLWKLMLGDQSKSLDRTWCFSGWFKNHSYLFLFILKLLNVIFYWTIACWDTYLTLLLHLVSQLDTLFSLSESVPHIIFLTFCRSVWICCWKGELI